MREAFKGLETLFTKDNAVTDDCFLEELPDILLDISMVMRQEHMMPAQKRALHFINNSYRYLSEHTQRIYEMNHEFLEVDHKEKEHFMADLAEYPTFFYDDPKSKKSCALFILNSKDIWYQDTGDHVAPPIALQREIIHDDMLTLMLKNAKEAGLHEAVYRGPSGYMSLKGDVCVNQSFYKKESKVVTTQYQLNRDGTFCNKVRQRTRQANRYIR